MAVHVAAVYLPRGENHVTVAMMLRVERSFEYTIRNGRMRDKGADHLCDPLRATLLLSARPPTGSTPGRGEGGGTGDNRVSALREPLAHGGRWPLVHGGCWFVDAAEWAEFVGRLTPSWTAKGAYKRLRTRGPRGRRKESVGRKRRRRRDEKVGGVLDGSRLLGGRARTYRTSCTYRPALSTT